MKIDRDLTRHVAKLACVSLGDDEAERLTNDLAAIVGYVAELDSLDTRDVPATVHLQGAGGSLRADEPHTSLPRDVALAAAPKSAHGGFAVPIFVGG